jgi:hypothetical protein
VQHVKALFDQQLKLINLHQQDDAKYQKLSRLKAHEMKDNPSEAEAIETLSNFGYKEYWLLVVEASKEYSHLVLPSGASRLHRNGTRDDSARIIEPGKRCECDHYLQFESMCEHELAKHEGKFIKSLFSERLFQPCKIEECKQVVITDDVGQSFITSKNRDFTQDFTQEEFTQDFTQEDFTQEDFTQVDEGDNTNDNDEDDASAADDNMTLGEIERELQKRPGYVVAGGGRKKQKVAPVSRTRIAQACATLTDLVSSKAKPEMSVAIFSSILQLQDIVRGEKPVDEVGKVVETAQQATQSRSLLPRHGPEANKQGRIRSKRMTGKVMENNGGTKPRKHKTEKRKCKFCQSQDCGNIQSCKQLKVLGNRIKQDGITLLLTTGLALINAHNDAAKLQELVTVENPVLESLPTSTKWLVVHRLYNLLPTSSATTEEHAGVEITCYGELGTVMEGLAPGAANFDHVIVKYTAVRNWISTSSKSDIGRRSSRLITSFDF